MASRWERAARGYALAPVRTVALVAGGVGLALAAGGIAAAGPWQGGQRTAEDQRMKPQVRVVVAVKPRPVPPPTWIPPQDVLQSADVTTDTPVPPVTSTPTAPSGAVAALPQAPLPTGAGLAAALAPALDSYALGKVTASVVDAATGRTLYSSGAATPQTPASTNKIATSVAALSLLGPAHRFTTTVVTPAPGRIVLVGGGDPTLTAAATHGADPQASLATLADRTAAALKSTGTRTVRLGYDISLFSGPALHPIGINDNIALVQALTVDEGRLDPHSTENAPRYADPAATAASTFAGLLRARGITVTGDPATTTLPKATAKAAGTVAGPLAEVSSQPLGEIVERMLTESDNDIAETLGHQVAIAAGGPATFAGGAAAVRQELTGLGVRLGGTRLIDASGLSGQDVIPADVLTQLLVLASSPAHPELRSVVSGLPVAGFTGTLDNRYDSGSSAAGLGVVRAKTGSLSTVNTLAGLVVDRDGRLLVFAFMSNGSGDATSARTALDRLAGRVAVCGCR
jgi:serine-type D-Ala-D-Ala carboxypeptidase/endopeptidase (penicillin-binding protein 4)